MDKIKLAIIGAGYMAENHIRVFKDINSIELCGIFSRSQDKALNLSNKYKIQKVYSSISSMYQETKAELLVVAVSEISLQSICNQIFKYSWNILIEKPIGINYANSLQIYQTYQKYKKGSIFGAFNRRHYSSTRSVLKDLDKVESPRFVNIIDQEYPEKAKRNGSPDLVVENYMYANSIHLIDLFNIFCRGSIKCIKPLVKWDKLNPLFVSSFIEFSSGDYGIYQANWNAPGPWSVSISTSKKRWEMKPIEKASIQSIETRETNSYIIDDWDKNFKPGLRYQAKEFVKTLKSEITNLPTIEDSLESMSLIREIYGQ